MELKPMMDAVSPRDRGLGCSLQMHQPKGGSSPLLTALGLWAEAHLG